MRNSQPLLRCGLTVAAAALPLALATGPAGAEPGISVSTSGSAVSVTTGSCTPIDGRWGTASLLTSSQGSFSQGRQVELTGTTDLQSAAWSSVSAGTYTVIVVCSDGSTAGTQSIIVSPAVPSPRISPTASPTRGVMGGVGGGSTDYGTITLVAGGALLGCGVAATAWYLRRRSKPYRL